jgi:hypothetical protein
MAKQKRYGAPARVARSLVRFGIKPPLDQSGLRIPAIPLLVRAIYFKTNSGKQVPWKRWEARRMPAKVERRELVPMIIATIVAAIGAFCLWSDLRNDSLGRGDGMITSAVASRAGATVAPSELPAHLVAPQTVVCTENLIRVDDAMESPKMAE